MFRSDYYDSLRSLALRKRAEYGLRTQDITLSELRRLYTHEGITIDRCPRRLRKLKAAYFNDEDGCSVLLNMDLPEEPRLFAMCHELKHHLVDRDKLHCFCQEVYKTSPVIEIGAEVFAAELIFPQDEFGEYVRNVGIVGRVTPEHIVRLEHISPVRISYQFIRKRLEWLGLIEKSQFRNVQFQKLHQQIYGSPYYGRQQVGVR